MFMRMSMLYRRPRSGGSVVQMSYTPVLVSMSVPVMVVEFGPRTGSQERGRQSVLELNLLCHRVFGTWGKLLSFFSLSKVSVSSKCII